MCVLCGGVGCGEDGNVLNVFSGRTNLLFALPLQLSVGSNYHNSLQNKLPHTLLGPTTTTTP